MSSSPTAEIRGHRAQVAKAETRMRALAAASDLALSLLLFGLGARLARLPALPLGPWALTLAACLALPWALARATAGRSPGEALWHLRPRSRPSVPWARRELLQPLPYSRRQLWTSAAWSLLAAKGAVAAVAYFLGVQPLLREAARETWPAAMPASTATESWSVLPFYYSLGSWPLVYGGHPVLFSIPYEKGPPLRFVGRVNAKWGSARVTIEGPKSPVAGSVSRDALRDCLTRGNALSCLAHRREALSRHLDEMSRVGGGARAWTLAWFAFENPALPEAERLEGFFLRAEGATASQERYVLITPKGGHQAFYLDLPEGDPAASARARELFRTALSSQRATGSLEPGKAWIDRELASVRLGADATPEELARAEALLTAKLTVDPGVLQAYFHLSGTALTLLRLGAREPSADHWLKSGTQSQRALVQGLRSFARDVGPADSPLIRRIDDQALEALKY